MKDKVKTCFIYLMNSIQTGKLYSEEHPIFKESVERLYGVLQEILQVKKNVILGIISGELAWEDEIFFDLSKKLGSLIGFLIRNHIERIIFEHGVTLEELTQFMTFLARIKRMENVDEEGYYSLQGIPHIRAARLRSLDKVENAETKSKELQGKYENSLQAVSNSLNIALDEEEINYLDLRFNVLNMMEDFMDMHQELISLISIKEKDLLTFVHLLNVSLLSMFFSSKLEFSKDNVLDLGIAALFHDIGKLFISKKILQKTSKLAEEEYIEMKDHPLLGAKILDKYRESFGVLPLIVAFEHHLRYDLSGYPKVAYPQKPYVASLIVSICDVYDALALRRSYKRDYPPDRIFEVMMIEKGKMFDPQLLDNFFHFIGVWPVGAIVALSDERVAVVREINEQDKFRPKVEVVSPERSGEIINLVSNRKIHITEALNPHDKGKEYLRFILK